MLLDSVVKIGALFYYNDGPDHVGTSNLVSARFSEKQELPENMDFYKEHANRLFRLP
jgi:hypothetical protein